MNDIWLYLELNAWAVGDVIYRDEHLANVASYKTGLPVVQLYKRIRNPEAA